MVIPRQGTVDDELVIDQFQFFLHMFVLSRLGLADAAERSVVAKRCATPRDVDRLAVQVPGSCRAATPHLVVTTPKHDRIDLTATNYPSISAQLRIEGFASCHYQTFISQFACLLARSRDRNEPL
jgi:hypothetical protein